MEREIGAICIYEESGQQELHFWDIFLDERWVDCIIYVSDNAIFDVGYLNRKLQGKQAYEYMLRIAKEYSVVCMTQAEFNIWQKQRTEKWQKLTVAEVSAELEDYRTDCYVIGRYKAELLETGLFESVVENMLLRNNPSLNECLEKMLSGSKEYYELYDATQPILMYSGDDICYGVLDQFVKNFGKALSEQGELVEYYDISKHEIQDIILCVKRRWKAIIGVQTYMFSVKKKDGTFVHDEMDAPLFNFVFDHPIWLRNHLEEVPKRMTILTLDQNYVRFIEKYYGHKAVFFPPAGVEHIEIFVERKYDVSFVGSYGDYLAEKLFELKKNAPDKAKFANHFLTNLRREKNKTPEELLWKTIEEMGVECDTAQFKDLLSEYRWMIYGIMNYYRKKVVETLLEAGIELHVYGDTWKDCALRKYPNLNCHDAVTGEEALDIYSQSKISLNIMSWHKGGFTERIANAMLQKSVILTDKTSYLEENFRDGENILMFDLDEIERLPARVKGLLGNPSRLECMAENGYYKIKEEHTWETRAKKFIEELL